MAITREFCRVLAGTQSFAVIFCSNCGSSMKVSISTMLVMGLVMLATGGLPVFSNEVGAPEVSTPDSIILGQSDPDCKFSPCD